MPQLQHQHQLHASLVHGLPRSQHDLGPVLAATSCMGCGDLGPKQLVDLGPPSPQPKSWQHFSPEASWQHFSPETSQTLSLRQHRAGTDCSLPSSAANLGARSRT